MSMVSKIDCILGLILMIHVAFCWCISHRLKPTAILVLNHRNKNKFALTALYAGLPLFIFGLSIYSCIIARLYFLLCSLGGGGFGCNLLIFIVGVVSVFRLGIYLLYFGLNLSLTAAKG